LWLWQLCVHDVGAIAITHVRAVVSRLGADFCSCRPHCWRTDAHRHTDALTVSILTSRERKVVLPQKFFAERERWICGEDIAPLLYSGSKHGTAVPNAGALVSCCACLPLHLSDNRKFMVWNIDLWSSCGNLPFCNPRNMCLFKFCCDGASRADFVHGSNIISWIRLRLN
jgi:hypothetical protein